MKRPTTAKYERVPTHERRRGQPDEDGDGNDSDFVEFVTPNKKEKSTLKNWKRTVNFLPEQFRLTERPVPWKAIGYAFVLFFVGTFLLLCGCLIHVGHIDNDKYGDRLWPLTIFGVLMFIPGSYHVYMAVQTFRGVPGFTFDEFPSFD